MKPSRLATDIETADLTARSAESHGALLATIWSGLALLFSGYSFYETVLRQPQLTAFVPPVIQYSHPSNDAFEVFNIPVTIANVGARTGTVLAIELVVTDASGNASKRFYAADFGRWTMTNARSGTFRPFAPIAVAGKSSISEPVLFYTRTGETLQSIIAQEGGRYRFELSFQTVADESYGWLDRLWGTETRPVSFEMEIGELDHRNFTEATMMMTSTAWSKPSAAP